MLLLAITRIITAGIFQRLLKRNLKCPARVFTNVYRGAWGESETEISCADLSLFKRNKKTFILPILLTARRVTVIL